MQKLLQGLIMACLGCLLWSHAADGALSISPAFLEVSFERGRPSGQFIITNTGSEAVRYRIMASHFTYGSSGNFSLVPPDENSLAPWIKFNPKELSLAPKTSQRVRFVVVPRGKLREQVYWGAMELESLEANIATSKDRHGRVMNLAVIPAIVVPIFGVNGDVRYDFQVKEISTQATDQGFQFQVTIVNSGSGHLLLDGHYELIDPAGKVLVDGRFVHSYIMPESTVHYARTIKSDLRKGRYTLEVYCKAKGKGLEKHGSAQVTIQ